MRAEMLAKDNAGLSISRERQNQQQQINGFELRQISIDIQEQPMRNKIEDHQRAEWKQRIKSIDYNQKILLMCFASLCLVLILRLQFMNGSLGSQIQKLKKKTELLQNDLSKNHKEIDQLRNQNLYPSHANSTLNRTESQKIEKQISELAANQMSKEIKGYNILVKNSKFVPFQISKNYLRSGFKTHYARKNPNSSIIIKKTDQSKQNIILYTQEPILNSMRSFFTVKIERTNSKDISIGFILQKKLEKLYCGFCEDQLMYYIYSKNGQFYHGSSFLGLFSDSSPSKIKEIKEKDQISVFYDQQQKQIMWYVNKKYVGHILIEKEHYKSSFYPFIVMVDENDQIELFQQLQISRL